MKTYKVIGIMSGSSMDGVDLAYCEFSQENGKWNYEIKESETIPYDDKWRVRLSQLRKQSTLVYVKTDVFYGHYLGQLVNSFCKKNNLNPDFISSHGHTVFHYPEIKITAQVGDGASLSAITGLPVVSDFRRYDVAKGGQGAPLVGIGDKHLFSEYDYCINLGGFANISGKDKNNNLTAFDICACNILLNRVARDMGYKYDENGQIAEKGSIHFDLLSELNQIEYYSLPYPKSLNRDWINQEFWHVVREYSELENQDKMKTLVDHIAFQISNSIDTLAGDNGKGKKILVSGGSAYNKTLIEHLRSLTEAEIIIPSSQIIDYKEALIFAFIGVLRIQNEVNTLGEFTGANSNSVSGGLHGDFSKLF